MELGTRTSATPVVLLHGLYDSRRTWNPVAAELARDRAVLLLDLPGHGRSARPDATYSLLWYAHIVGCWLDALGFEAVDVVGHSFGGGIAQMLLLERRKRVRRLILVASGGLGKEISAPLRLASIPFVVEHLGQPFMGMGTRLALRAQGGMTDDDLDELVALNAAPGSARAFSRTVRDVIDWHGQRRNFADRAHEVGDLPPIAVFWGDHDTIIPMEHGERFAASMPGVRFVRFAGCGHYLHRERPDAFVRSVREFLGNSRPTTVLSEEGCTT